MNTIDVKSLVERAISTEWPTFEREHPRLAAVLDQTLLCEEATKSLADDPDYQETLARATAAGLAADVAYDTIANFVRDWIRKLV